MSVSTAILIFAVLLMLKKCDAFNIERDIEENYTHQVIQQARAFGRPSLDEYNRDRRAALLFEESKTLGSELVLSANEIEANKILMLAKAAEYQEGFVSPRKFAPAKHLFEVLDKISNSKLFKIIADMPKGAVLHTHSTAMGSTDFLIELTKRDNLWTCNGPEGLNLIAFEFRKDKPKTKLRKECSWTKMSDLRKSKGQDKVDQYLHERLSLYPKTQFKDNNEVWRDFESIFSLLRGLLHYAPVRKEYLYNALTEFHKDNVQYVEIRTSLSVLYDLKGKDFTVVDTVRLYEDTVKEFMDRNPSFCGCKLIISPYRGKNDGQLSSIIDAFYDIQQKFPDFIAGFDLVGQEEMGRPLKDLAPMLLEMQYRRVKFYFHAGETNWFGSTIDENLLDAIILGTKRIGHGYALTKHPMILKILKENDIAVELNPISNQVLQLVGDLRNHPAAYLFSDKYPVVVSSDDPSFWKATPLSHDFYVAFLGIASAHADLKFLKKLALNSIQYSAMTDDQKGEAMLWWHSKWHEFINKLISQKY